MNGVKKLPIWALFVIAFLLTCAVICVGLFVTMRSTWSRLQVLSPPVDTRTDYAKMIEFSSTSTDAQTRTQLQDAFTKKKLAILWSATLPDHQRRLVLAAPTLDGTIKSASCQDAQAFCAFFIEDGASSRLLTRGSRIMGFQHLERFSDADHAIIAVKFSLLNYSSIERLSLDLKTGELVPLLVLEMDVDDQLTRLTASGYGDIVLLSIDSIRDQGRDFPTRVTVQTDDGKILSQIDQATIGHFADLQKKANNPLKSLTVEPSDTDVSTLKVSVSLFGESYLFDLKQKTLTPVRSSQNKK